MRPRQRAELLVERRHARAIEMVDAQMILQVAADRGMVASTTAIPALCRSAGGADAGELQQLRRIDRAGRRAMTSRPALRRPADAVAACSRRRSRGARRTGCESHCASVSTRRFARRGRGTQIGARRRHAQPDRVVISIEADAFLVGAVEVSGCAAGPPRWPACEIRSHKRMAVGVDVLHGQRAVGAAPSVGTTTVLELLEVGQHVVPAPARIAERLPVVEIAAAARARSTMALIELEPPSTLPRGQ